MITISSNIIQRYLHKILINRYLCRGDRCAPTLAHTMISTIKLYYYTYLYIISNIIIIINNNNTKKAAVNLKIFFFVDH